MMKKTLLFLVILTCGLLGCKDDDSGKNRQKALFDRTVLVYVMGENALDEFIAEELQEMRQGATGLGNNALVIYMDDCDKSRPPYLIRISDGQTVDSLSLGEDPISTDPKQIRRILDLTASRYRAKEYGLLLWGHASGWLYEDSVEQTASSRRKAFGLDSGNNWPTNNGKWINMPTLASVLEGWGQPLKFIFADCCQFQCIESAYELRHATEYIIGSPAEIPGEGAPYATLTRRLFAQDDHFYEGIVDAYYAQEIDGLRVPLSVIRTDKLEDFPQKTRKILRSMASVVGQDPDLTSLIYYKGLFYSRKERMMYDMNDFMLKYAPEDEYRSWKQSLDSIVIYKKMASRWMTNNQVRFADFTMTTERYGGVSMFIPQQIPSSNYMAGHCYNEAIRKTSWYRAAGLNELGW